MSDWIEHDGKGLPVPRGTPVDVIVIDPGFFEGERTFCGVVAGALGGDSWNWSKDCAHVLRYRIRRPRAMETIDRILADVPEREPA